MEGGRAEPHSVGRQGSGPTEPPRTCSRGLGDTKGFKAGLGMGEHVYMGS